MAQLALVLDYLHTSGVIYRDMKMENVLVTPQVQTNRNQSYTVVTYRICNGVFTLTSSQGHLLVTDFGLSKWLTMHERTWTICGTLQYMAPEVLSAHDGGTVGEYCRRIHGRRCILCICIIFSIS